MALNEPHIPAVAVVLRVISILGMGLSVSAAVLLLVAAEWLWGGLAVAALLPFVGMMYLVERLIPDPPPRREPPGAS